MKRICIIACANKKNDYETSAEGLYNSPLFKKSKEFAKNHFDTWYIISAKYGLIEPKDVIHPYNQTLKNMNIIEREKWAKLVHTEIIKRVKINDSITLIAGKYYREFLIKHLERSGYKINVLFPNLSIGKQLSILNRINTSHEKFLILNEFYKILERLENGLGGKRILKNCNGKMEWPKYGVYFFFDKNEFRLLDQNFLRIVRVGTHGVSLGSKSTLWNRLRTHKGTNDGIGNHRASVFRLHVGAALMNKNQNRFQINTWGKLKSASKNIRSLEIKLEKSVSNYIRDLPFLWISVYDEPGPKSDRSYIERNLISLLSGPRGPIDIASKNWLGNYSPHHSIRKSALWNINHIEEIFDHNFLEIFNHYVDITLGLKTITIESIAPNNWYLNRKKIFDYNQTELFEDPNV